MKPLNVAHDGDANAWASQIGAPALHHASPRSPPVRYNVIMSDTDPRSAHWSLEQRRMRQEVSSHESFAVGARPDEPLLHAGGILIKTCDNLAGERELELDVRPVVLGQVEVVVRLSTQGPDASRPHGKRAYLYTSPAALRDLARQLLETADAAEKLKLKPKPVR